MWSDAEKFLSKDRYIGPLIKRYGSCTLEPRAKNFYFEDLVDAIVQQQLSMKAAASVFNKIKEAVSKKVGPKRLTHHKWRQEKSIACELTPKSILDLSDDDLRRCGLSKAKVSFIKELAREFYTGGIDVDSLQDLSDDEIIEKLIKVKGVGIWTIQMFLMFTLCRADVFPVKDLGLKKAFRNVVGMDLQEKEMLDFSSRWRPYRTIASWYLWKSLEG
jgi:DNA-3-methyladenine glycosylase II